MKQFSTRGIVLKRINFGDSDRIVSFLTIDHGLASVMVKGARKQGSKLAAGVELFTESDLTLIQGRGQLDHLISSRPIICFSQIVKNYERVELAYDVIAKIYKAANQFSEVRLYNLIRATLEDINNSNISISLIEAWFKLNLLEILGQQPNLTHDIENQKLKINQKYTLIPEDGAFKPEKLGEISTEQIKAWRVLLVSSASKAQKIGGLKKAIDLSLPQIRLLFEYQFS